MDDPCRDYGQVIVVASGAVIEARVVTESGPNGGAVEGNVATGTAKLLVTQATFRAHIQNETFGLFIWQC